MRISARRRSFPIHARLAGLLLVAAHGAIAQSPSIPDRLADTTFWRMVTTMSEPGGFFRSENFVSNETSYQWVIPELLRTTRPGGVYLGVGPDQNFTYIIALQPKIAFIFDIRRQNLLQHLMYKALIENAPDRADFVAALFARPRPPGLDSATRDSALLAAYAAVAPDSTLYRKTLAAIFDRLRAAHGFALSNDDSVTIAGVYTAFVEYGPDITYSSGGRGYGRFMPSYADMQAAADSDGVHRSYLASEANYRALRQMELDNRIVPLVGDFAGPTAIRAVGAWLKERNASVTAFYLSNVEQYLFQDPQNWRSFYTNAGTLPLDSSSTFIRSQFGGLGGYYGPYGRGGMRSRQLLASMMDQVKAFNEGRLTSYYEVLNTSR
ncbi:MAG TPA: hypothetical protein VHB25_02635 [Gemmatimonadaceae bacterium]|nr:hypothetical protein [Gemmatimonadaceae bacterium]